MTKNMGSVDRGIRIVVACVIAVLYFTQVISGVLAIVLGIFAVLFVVTGIVGFCPGYLPFKFSTRKPAAGTPMK